MDKKTFVRGAALLGIVGLIIRIIGAFYRIPLTNIINTKGMAIYSVGFAIYSYLVVVSTSGIPTAISKLVAEKVSLGDYRGAHRIFQVAFKILLVFGIVTTLIVYFGHEAFARLLGDELASFSMEVIAPSLFFVSAISAYRGYFQGLQLMAPTAVSQLIEQIGKLVVGLYLAQAWMPMGVEYAAGGALLGVTASEAAALVLLVGMYNRKKRDLKMLMRQSVGTTRLSFKTAGKMLAQMAVPVTIGASITPMMAVIDASMIQRRLVTSGIETEMARTMYGTLSGPVNTLVNMPAIFTIGIAISLVPAISQSLANKNYKDIREKASMGLKLSVLIGLPCAVGLYVLAVPIIKLLYGSSDVDIELAAALLRTSSFGLFSLSLVQSMTGVLQGLGRPMTPVKNLFAGSVLKIAVSYVLLGITTFNIHGANIGTVTCYTVAALLNIINVARITHMRFEFGNMLLKPLMSVALMGAAVYFSYGFFALKFGVIISTLASVMVGVLIYGIAVMITGALKESDMDFIPGGGKIASVMHAVHLWK